MEGIGTNFTRSTKINQEQQVITDDFGCDTIANYLLCLCREGTSKQLKHKLTIADYPTISQLFMFYDREQKGALGYFNIAEMLEDFNIKPDKIAIKGILNDFGSWNEELCEEECVKHQLTIADFLRIITTWKTSVSVIDEDSIDMESIYTTPFINHQSLNAQEEKWSECSKRNCTNSDENKQYIKRNELKSFIQKHSCSSHDIEDDDIGQLVGRVFEDMELCEDLPILDLVLQIYESENREELRKMALTSVPSETLVSHEFINFQYYNINNKIKNKMSDSINCIRYYLLKQEKKLEPKNHDRSFNSSLDSRYDTDSSPQRPLHNCFRWNSKHKNRKVCCEENIESNVDDQFYFENKASKATCNNKRKSSHEFLGSRSISFQNIVEAAKEDQVDNKKCRASSMILKHHSNYKHFKSLTITMNQFDDNHQETSQSK